MASKKKTNYINIRDLFLDLQKELDAHIRTARKNVKHGPTQGDVTEAGWRKMLAKYLPARYSVEKAFVVDSTGTLSQQIDLVVFDRQYCPFVLHTDDAKYVPAESVYAVFEVKPDLDGKRLAEAIEKAGSVRRLKRTSVNITSAAGRHRAVKPKPILAGILSHDSNWKPAFGKPFKTGLGKATPDGRLDLGCSLNHGAFNVTYNGRGMSIDTSDGNEALVSFFLTLLHRLQPLGTVTAIDLTAYGQFTLGRKHGS